MNAPAEEIAAAVRARGFALPSEVREVVRLAEGSDSPVAHALVGDLIQLLDDDSEYDLAAAEAAYLRAIAIDPSYADGYASLGFFYDAVNDDPERAQPYFERAIALGSTRLPKVFGRSSNSWAANVDVQPTRTAAFPCCELGAGVTERVHARILVGASPSSSPKISSAPWRQRAY